MPEYLLRARGPEEPALRVTLSKPARFIIGFALATSLLLPKPGEAGRISSSLQDELSHLAPSHPASAIFILEHQANIAGLDQALKSRNATRQERHREVVTALRSSADATQGSFLAELDARQERGLVFGYTAYWIANLVVVRASRSCLEELANRAEVEVVERNFRVELIKPVEDAAGSEADGPRGIGVPPGLRAINAPRVWYELGVTGAGTIVANQDTGVDGNHPALKTRWRGYNGAHPAGECWLNVIGGDPLLPRDFYGHGTHVMGTITGLGAGTQDTIGVAWGAEWIACNSIANENVGPEFDNDVITCLQWLADPDGDPGTVEDVPDVVQNSWRINETFLNGYTDCDTRWWEAIDNCEAAGVVSTWSAGNEGPVPASIGSPADRASTLTNAFSVGAVDANSGTPPFMVASFSSRGPTGCLVPLANQIKPEVVAPGVAVYSSVPGGGYQSANWSGTSMAGPHVAGVVGLMRAVNPDLDVDEVKQILMDTAIDGGLPGEDNDFGWGFIDAYAAVIAAAAASTGAESRSSPAGAWLFGSHPNPARGETVIPFQLPAPGAVELTIYDLAGRRVRSLVSGELGAGGHSVVWNGRDGFDRQVHPGVYLYRMKAAGFRAERKLLLLP